MTITETTTETTTEATTPDAEHPTPTKRVYARVAPVEVIVSESQSYDLSVWEPVIGGGRTATWRARQRGIIPPPDFFVGRSPRWLGLTVFRFQRGERPRRR